jgi:Domain of unknown function (DUF1918)
MASVGDRVRVLPNKSGQPPRDGVVTGVTGTLLRVRWTTGEETTFIPGSGSVAVLGKARTGASPRAVVSKRTGLPPAPKKQAHRSSATKKATKSTTAKATKARKKR